MQPPSIRQTVEFVRAAHRGAAAATDGQPRWLRAVEVMALLPAVLPGIRVTHADRQVALLHDVLEATAARERDLLRAGFPEAVVESVVRLSRFDAGLPRLDHLRAVAASRDLSAMRAAMAKLLHEGGARGPRAAPGGRRAAAATAEPERHREAVEALRRGLGC